MTVLKRVVVTMSDDCGCLLKRYAALFNMTQSEVLYEAARSHIHKQAYSGCQGAVNLLTDHGIKLDNRAHKECYGFQCRACKHDKACRVGKYEGLYAIQDRYKHLLSPTIADNPSIADQPG